jgi:hypothetical protein
LKLVRENLTRQAQQSRRKIHLHNGFGQAHFGLAHLRDVLVDDTNDVPVVMCIVSGFGTDVEPPPLARGELQPEEPRAKMEAVLPSIRDPQLLEIETGTGISSSHHPPKHS